ncbi:aspartate/glutamate racemase family protein [Mesorhizobium sp. M0848]|uniref:arylsulfatase n=1 Tax=Mesorhizobium sp. M0848 TaxID=2957012 RepID=UPI003338EE2E
MSKLFRIALIHATPVAIEPILDAFRATWPEAEPINILDESLALDRAKAAEISNQLIERIVSLTEYGVSTGSTAVLFTCSAFGPAIEYAASKVEVPVLKPNEAMFEAAIARGGKTAMLYTFAPAKESMEQEFREEARKLGAAAEIISFFVPGAIDAVRVGDVATHNRLIAEAATCLSGFEAVTLAQFSMARALSDVQAATTIPVLSSPEQAVAKLRGLIGS